MALKLLICWTVELKTKNRIVFDNVQCFGSSEHSFFINYFRFYVMKNSFFIKIAFVLIPFNSKTIAQTLTLKQCINQAVNNNIQVKQSGLSVENAEVNLSQAKSNLLPDLNGNYSYGFNQGRSVDPITNSYINQQLYSSGFGVNSGVIIYNGLRLKNLIQQNTNTLEANKLDFQQAKDNLTLNVILAYLQVLSSEDVLETSKKQLESTQKQVERMSIMVKQGTAGNYQLADLKAQQASEQVNIMTVENNLQQAKLSLCQLLNMTFNPKIQLERNDKNLEMQEYTTSAQSVFKTAQQNLALIKAFGFKIKSAENAIKVAHAGMLPQLSFNANLGSSFSSLAKDNKNENIGYLRQMNNNLGTFAGLNLQVPIFNNFQIKNRVKQAEIALKNTKLDLESNEWQLRQNIEQAWLNMNTTFARYKVLQEQVKYLEESFRAADLRFTNGTINPTELLIIKNNFDRAKINLTQAKYEYAFRTKLLDFYQGKSL